MRTRTIGSIEVSAVGFGAMGFSHGYGPSVGEDEAINLIRQPHELGCTFFDTAEGYGAGHNERLLGRALAPIRDKVVIATKFVIPSAADEADLNRQIRQHLDTSLKRLGTDRIDLYYQHRNPGSIPVEAVARVMGELIGEGRIRGWGQSQVSEGKVRRAHAVTPVTAVQSEYSMMERMFEADVIPACGELGIGFVPFSPLSSGFLSGKYHPEQTYTGDDVRRVITRFTPENMRANQPLLELLCGCAENKGSTPAQIALAWMLHKYDYLVPIPGMRSLDRISENLGAAEITLTGDEFERIEARLADIARLANMK
ncbi:MAG: aldo/keto reductase [Steroidobacteraceae bacterium]|nr:aldo/keto reductase [Nevskiaceae bacterium]